MVEIALAAVAGGIAGAVAATVVARRHAARWSQPWVRVAAYLRTPAVRPHVDRNRINLFIDGSGR